jgi:hypothetical protein
MYIVECPHCSQPIEILELNCRIFRCGVFKSNFQQIDPHLPKERCDLLVYMRKIYGCGRPFYAHDAFDPSGNKIIICKPCDYI